MRIDKLFILHPFTFFFRSTFNFSVPELSCLAALLLFAVMLVLHFIPIRVLLLAWGIIKFSKRIIRPHTVTNNEVLDFLSRVPDDEELVSGRTCLINFCFSREPFHYHQFLPFRFNFESFHCNNRTKRQDAMHEIRRSNHRIVLMLRYGLIIEFTQFSFHLHQQFFDFYPCTQPLFSHCALKILLILNNQKLLKKCFLF